MVRKRKVSGQKTIAFVIDIASPIQSSRINFESSMNEERNLIQLPVRLIFIRRRPPTRREAHRRRRRRRSIEAVHVWMIIQLSRSFFFCEKSGKKPFKPSRLCFVISRWENWNKQPLSVSRFLPATRRGLCNYATLLYGFGFRHMRLAPRKNCVKLCAVIVDTLEPARDKKPQFTSPLTSFGWFNVQKRRQIRMKLDIFSRTEFTEKEKSLLCALKLD